jgi:hypothetical protein
MMGWRPLLYNPAFRGGGFLRASGVSIGRWRGLTSGKLTIILGQSLPSVRACLVRGLGQYFRNLFLTSIQNALLTQGRHEKLLRNKRGDDLTPQPTDEKNLEMPLDPKEI